MSRIDISVTEKSGGKLLASRGFMRMDQLIAFCQDHPDRAVADFAFSILIESEMDRKRLHNFITQLDYVIYRLDKDPKSALTREAHIDRGDFLQGLNYLSEFIDDLREGAKYLRELRNNFDPDDILVSIG